MYLYFAERKENLGDQKVGFRCLQKPTTESQVLLTASGRLIYRYLNRHNADMSKHSQPLH